MTKLFSLFLIINSFYSISAQTGNFFKTFAGNGLFYLADIDTTHDGGYIMCGADYDITGGDFVIIKVDSGGNEKWRYTNTDFNFQTGKNSNYGYRIKESNNHEFIMIGQITPDTLGNYSDMIFAKLDSLGNLKWKKRFNYSLSEDANTLLFDSPSSFIVGGTTVGNNIFLKMNLAGDTLWTKLTPFNGIDFSPQETAFMGGLYSIGGHTDSLGHMNIMFTKIDTTGAILWKKSYSDSLTYSITTDVMLTLDSSCIAFSTYIKNGFGYTIKVHEFDLYGNLLNAYSPQLHTPNISGTFQNDSSILFSKFESLNYDSIYFHQLNLTNNSNQIVKGYYLPHYSPRKMILDRKGDIVLLLRYYNLGGPIAYAALLKEGKSSIGVTEIRTPLNVQVYPNPAHERVTFKLNDSGTPNGEIYTLTLFNNIGEKVRLKEYYGTKILELDIRNLAPGSYYYFIKDKRNTPKFGKLIINKSNKS